MLIACTHQFPTPLLPPNFHLPTVTKSLSPISESVSFLLYSLAKPDRERQILYDITYMWKLLIYRQLSYIMVCFSCLLFKSQETFCYISNIFYDNYESFPLPKKMYKLSGLNLILNLLFSCPVVSNSLQLHGLQHSRPLCEFVSS